MWLANLHVILDKTMCDINLLHKWLFLHLTVLKWMKYDDDCLANYKFSPAPSTHHRKNVGQNRIEANKIICWVGCQIEWVGQRWETRHIFIFLWCIIIHQHTCNSKNTSQRQREFIGESLPGIPVLYEKKLASIELSDCSIPCHFVPVPGGSSGISLYFNQWQPCLYVAWGLIVDGGSMYCAKEFSTFLRPVVFVHPVDYLVSWWPVETLGCCVHGILCVVGPEEASFITIWGSSQPSLRWIINKGPENKN